MNNNHVDFIFRIEDLLAQAIEIAQNEQLNINILPILSQDWKESRREYLFHLIQLISHIDAK